MKIDENVSLKSFNTFGIDCRARRFVEIELADDLASLARSGIEGKYFILGCGSNVLFTGDYDGTVIHMGIKNIRTFPQNDDSVLIEAGAGASWEDFVLMTVESGYYGLENLAMIPGSVGAAPVQNIGAYGAEQKDFVSEVKCVDLSNGEIIVLQAADCAFAYRSSIFKEEAGRNLVVTDVTYKLGTIPQANLSYRELEAAIKSMGIDHPRPDTILQTVSDLRRRKLPDWRQLGNAGSFFKNPVVDQLRFDQLIGEYPAAPHYQADGLNYKIPAAWLIEQCRYKGLRVGDAGIYEKHALIIVNYGAATGKDILNLAWDVQESVLDKFGIKLEPEVIIV